MKNVHYNWVQLNERRFINANAGWQRPEIEVLFEVLTDVTGKLHKPTGCNRCISNAKDVVWKAYQQEMARRQAETLD